MVLDSLLNLNLRKIYINLRKIYINQGTESEQKDKGYWEANLRSPSL